MKKQQNQRKFSGSYTALYLSWHIALTVVGCSVKRKNHRERLPDKEASGQVRIRFKERRARDSNPRELALKRFSRPPRYDHFASPPCVNIQFYPLFLSSVTKREEIDADDK